MTVPLVFLGAGGHGRVLLDLALEQSLPVIGITDSNPEMKGKLVWGVPVLGDDQAVLAMDPGSVRLVNGIGSLGPTLRRRDTWQKFRNSGFRFQTLVHHGALVSSRAVLEEGCQVLAGVVVQAGARIGENALLNTGASVDHDCDIGAHVHVAPGAVLSGGVFVGEMTHIGLRAAVIQGIHIGSGCLVAAGAVVIHDVQDGMRVQGLPAKVRTL